MTDPTPATVQVTTCPEALQFQPVPLAEAKEKPAGSVSVTVTVLSSRSEPAALDTLMVYWPVCPATKVPEWLTVTPRFTAGSDVALTICAINSTRSSPEE